LLHVVLRSFPWFYTRTHTVDWRRHDNLLWKCNPSMFWNHLSHEQQIILDKVTIQKLRTELENLYLKAFIYFCLNTNIIFNNTTLLSPRTCWINANTKNLMFVYKNLFNLLYLHFQSLHELKYCKYECNLLNSCNCWVNTYRLNSLIRKNCTLCRYAKNAVDIRSLTLCLCIRNLFVNVLYA